MTGRTGVAGKPRLLVTTSWDDGHPSDLRLADLMTRHGIAGTFFVPTRNVEGHAVMSGPEVRMLAQGFEIGGHGTDHVVLQRLAWGAVRYQVINNRDWLESHLGRKLHGFCYIQGKFNPGVRKAVRDLGFEYARAVTGFCHAPLDDPFAIPTTVQFFDHDRASMLRHFLKRGSYRHRFVLAWHALTERDLERRMARMIESCIAHQGLFHLWGHSWELDAYQLWDRLESVFRHLRSLGADAAFVDNYDAVRAYGLIPPSPPHAPA